MFDLDKAIASWLHRLSLNPVFLPEDIEELEGHLRDLIADFEESGWSEVEAFHWAKKRMGDYGFVEKEYKKVRWTKPKRRRHFRRSLYWEIIMLKNYIKTAFYALRKQKVYSFLNIAGLSIGIALSILALLYVHHEYSFNRDFSKSGQIYRVVQDIRLPNQEISTARMGPGLMDRLQENFPEVVQAAAYTNFRSEFTLKYEDRHFKVKSRYAVSPSIFDLFDIEIVRGDAETPFPDGTSFVISESTARKIFGDADPIGETITLAGPFLASWEMTVTAVARDMPVNSQFQFEYLDKGGASPNTVHLSTYTASSGHLVGCGQFACFRRFGG